MITITTFGVFFQTHLITHSFLSHGGFLLTDPNLPVSSALRAHLRPLPDGGQHLRGLRGGGLSGGGLLLHLPAAQAADPAANPLLPA